MQTPSHPLIPTRRVGQVISISPTPTPTVEVTIGGDPTVTQFVPYLDSYIPTVNDYVILLGNQGDYIVAGRAAVTGGLTAIADSAPTAALKGTNWDGVTPRFRQSWSGVYVTTGAGGFNAPIPVAYPNGLLWFQMTPGDNAASLGFIQAILSATSVSTLNGGAFTVAGAPVASANVRANCETLGW